MPRHKYAKTSCKQQININTLVAAINDISIKKKSIRSVARAYQIDKSKLFRYIAKSKDVNLDLSNASDAKLTGFLSLLNGKSCGKMVRSLSFFLTFLVSYYLYSDFC